MERVQVPVRLELSEPDPAHQAESLQLIDSPWLLCCLKHFQAEQVQVEA